MNDHSADTVSGNVTIAHGDDFCDLLPIYYKRLFPYGPFYRWLSYGGVDKNYFTRREFSFTLKDDIYIRFQSFSDQAELEKEIQRRNPYKIDIGAVYNMKPRDHKSYTSNMMKPLEKELVFDIDMTDYDDIRSCCQNADICKKCWPLMVIAIQIIDKALEDDFGFEHRLWVYSGRRGVHCWVADPSARSLTQSGRSAVAEYLSLVKGGETSVKKVSLQDRPHPSIQRAISTVKSHFHQFALESQDILGCQQSWEKVLALIPDDTVRQSISDEIAKQKTASDRWKLIYDSLQRDYQSKMGSKVARRNHVTAATTCSEIMLQYCYPRLDVNVSTGVNHLLKSPFCAHPKTGKVCVPIDVTDVENFDPFTVPSLRDLCQELDSFEVEHHDENTSAEKKRVKDYKRTSLNKHIRVFDKFLKKLETTWRGKLIEKSDSTGNF